MAVGDDGSGAVYSCETIEKLDGLQAVREVPGMYIGDPHDGSGLHFVLEALIGRAIDEHLARRCKWVELALLADGSAELRTDARGYVLAEGRSDAYPGQAMFTSLSGTARRTRRTEQFEYGHWNSFVVCANAVAERLTVDFSRQGRRWNLAFEKGVAASIMSRAEEGESGESVVRFKPDPLVFSAPALAYHRVEGLLRAVSLLVPGFTLTLRDEVSGRPPRTFRSTDGIADLVSELRTCTWPLSAAPVVLRAEQPDASGPWMKVELALLWEPTRLANLRGYANGVPTHGGGTHLGGLRRSLAGCLTTYAIEAGLRRWDQLPICPRESTAGLTAVVSLWHCHAQYGSSYMHAKLVSPEAGPFVANTINRQLFTWLREHPAEAAAIIRHALRRGRA